MPKVRASSGTIGTIRRPIRSSRVSSVSRRRKTIVVDIARLPEPSRTLLKASSGGSSSGLVSGRRLGR